MVDKGCPFCGADSSCILLNVEITAYGRIGYLACEKCGVRTKSKKLFGNPQEEGFALQKSLLWLTPFGYKRADGDGCPFCGSDKTGLVLSESQTEVLGHLACKKCKVQTKRVILQGNVTDTGFFMQKNMKLLYDLWNSRAKEV